MKGMMGPMMGMMGGGMKGGMMGKGKGPAAGGKGQGKGNPLKMFVGGLESGQPPPEDALREFFGQFGNIVELKLVLDDAGLSKGYCFVTYEEEEAIEKALANHEHNEINGKWVDCKVSNPNDANGAKPGDWYCPMCGDLVFAKRTACNSCGYSGPGMPALPDSKRAGTKPGDWICGSCGDLVFSYRDKCNKCGAPKTTGSQEIGCVLRAGTSFSLRRAPARCAASPSLKARGP